MHFSIYRRSSVRFFFYSIKNQININLLSLFSQWTILDGELIKDERVDDSEDEEMEPNLSADQIKCEIKCDNWDTVENFDAGFPAPEELLEVQMQTAEPLDRTEKKPIKNKKVRGQIQCCMCGKIFKKDAEFRKHCSVKHKKGVPEDPDKEITARHIYECEFCKRKYRMKKHLRDHYTDVNYVEPPEELVKKARPPMKGKICAQCGLKLYDKMALELHEATKHSDLREVKCEVLGCKAMFAHQFYLKKHMQMVHGEKKYM